VVKSVRVGALWSAALLLLGCNQLLGIEESGIAADTQSPVSCETREQCQSGEECIDSRCAPPNVAGSDAPVPPRDAQTPDRDAGDADVVVPMMDAGDAGDAGDADATDTGPDAPTAECENDALRCEGAAQIERSICAAGAWVATDPCENGELCDSTTGLCAPVVAGCSGREPGEPFCMGRERVVCGPDLVTAERETCPTIDHCQGSVDGRCLACVANEHRCEGNALEVCNAERNGFDSLATCDAAPCNAELGMCTTQVCEKDRYSCSIASNTLRLCNADGSDFLQQTPCNEGICDAEHGQCDVCAAGELGCANGTDVRVCDGEGQNLTMQSCAQYTSVATPLCSDALAACVACIAPTSTCVGAASQQACTATGTWDTPVACVNQTCYQGRCAGQCGPNVAPRCATGGGSEACGADGEWDVVETAAQCPVCIGAGVCVACTNGDTRCDDAGHQSTCVNNAWDVSTSCSNKTCVGKACTGECAPGQSECRADGRYTCNAQGTFARAQACPLCVEEAAGARCVTCALGAYQCMSADLYRCNDQQTGWTFVNTCDSPALCDATGKRCINEVCNPREVTCVGSELRTCNTTGSAYTAMTCSGTFNICDADGAAGVGQCDRCQEGATGCSSNTARSVCSADGQTLTTPACSGTTPACFNGGCTACNPSVTPTSCDGLDKMRTCQNNGSWGTAVSCVNETCLASSGMCDGSCAQGQARCATGANNVRERCGPSGEYVFDQTCPGLGAVCSGAGNCVACANGATRCESTSRQFTCSGNSWGSSFACTDQTCFGDVAGLGGRCQGNCRPTDKMCVSGQRAWDPCGGNGTPDAAQRTTCTGNPATDASWFVCRNQAGADTAACVAAPTLVAGFPDAATAGGSEAPIYNYEWLMQPITVGSEMKLTTLTASIKSVATTGQSILMAIYSQRRDIVSNALQPDRKLASSALSTAVSGNNTMNLVTPLTVAAGSYWLGVRISNGNTGDESEVGRIHAYNLPAGPYLWFTMSPVNATAPDPFPSAQIRSGFQLGMSATGKSVL
jgi:hypothetical protein